MGTGGVGSKSINSVDYIASCVCDGSHWFAMATGPVNKPQPVTSADPFPTTFKIKDVEFCYLF